MRINDITDGKHLFQEIQSPVRTDQWLLLGKHRDTLAIFPFGSSLGSLRMTERCKKPPFSLLQSKIGFKTQLSFLNECMSPSTPTPQNSSVWAPVLFTVQCGHQTKVYFVRLSSWAKTKICRNVWNFNNRT